MWGLELLQSCSHCCTLQAAMRTIWNRYCADAGGIIFVVDAADRSRLAQAREALGMKRLVVHPRCWWQHLMLLGAAAQTKCWSTKVLGPFRFSSWPTNKTSRCGLAWGAVAYGALFLTLFPYQDAVSGDTVATSLALGARTERQRTVQCVSALTWFVRRLHAVLRCLKSRCFGVGVTWWCLLCAAKGCTRGFHG